MTTSVQTFTFEDQSIRTATIDDAPWFVASDICRVLGMRPDQSKDSRINADEQRVLAKGRDNYPSLFKGTDYKLRMISESGMYKLVLRSTKANATPFQEWVTREVLPTIRKTGSYSLAPGQEMPLPTEIKDAFQVPVRANLAMAEKLGATMKAMGGLVRARGIARHLAILSTARRLGEPRSSTQWIVGKPSGRGRSRRSKAARLAGSRSHSKKCSRVTALIFLALSVVYQARASRRGWRSGSSWDMRGLRGRGNLPPSAAPSSSATA